MSSAIEHQIRASPHALHMLERVEDMLEACNARFIIETSGLSVQAICRLSFGYLHRSIIIWLLHNLVEASFDPFRY